MTGVFGVLRNLWHNRCLDAYYGAHSSVYLYNCHQDSHQQWRADGISTSRGGTIAGRGGCLDADTNGHNRNGTRVRMWPCNGQPQQRWYVRWLPYRGFALQNGIGWPFGKCLDADVHHPHNFTRVQLWDCNQAVWQAWVFGMV